MASNHDLLELYKQHSAGEDKYTYFLLAAAAAAIGFAVQKTEGLRLTWWLLPVGLATVTWGLSFVLGCKRITWVQVVIYANCSLLELKAGTHPQQPRHPMELDAALSGVRSALAVNIEKARFYSQWQFRTLILGAAFFLIWRVAELIRTTYLT